jgi:hypothetical protein
VRSRCGVTWVSPCPVATRISTGDGRPRSPAKRLTQRIPCSTDACELDHSTKPCPRHMSNNMSRPSS